MAAITAIARALRDEILAQEDCACAAEINDGDCTHYAQQLAIAVRSTLGIEVEIMNAATLLQAGHPAAFDRDLLQSWPGMVLPRGMDWDDLDRFAQEAPVTASLHTWVAHEGLFYDAEAVDGLGSPFDLPVLERALEDWRLGLPRPHLGG